MFDIESIANRVTMTPAERAVVREQATTLSVEATTLAHHAECGEAGDVLRAFIEMSRTMKDMENLCSMSVRRAVQEAQG